jgi:flagellar motor switch protein FliG
MSKLRDQRHATVDPLARPSKEYPSLSKVGQSQSGLMQKQQIFNGTNVEFRKAAILIDSLDDDSARLFLRKLNMSTAREIHQLAKELGLVTKEEKENVLAEFLERIQEISSNEKAGS